MKKKLLQADVFVKYVCLFALFVFTGYSVLAQANPRLTSVAPEDDLATVTITNFGDMAIDMSDYWLCLRPGTYRQISTLNPVGNVTVMPSETVTVSYNVDVGVADDGLSLYVPDTPTNGGFGTASNLIDFVQWGGSGNIRESLAVQQGVWGTGDFIVGSGPYTYSGNGTENGVNFWNACTVDAVAIQLVGGGTEISTCAGDGADDLIDVEVVGTGVGTNNGWVITDNATGEILGLPAAPPFNLEGAGAGICGVWYIRYEDGLTGLTVGADVAGLSGCFDLSNPVLVDRSGVDGAAIQLVGGGTEISTCAGDGADDLINVEVVGTGVGTNNGWVITDNATGEILGLPAAPPFNLEGAGAGVCAVWYIRYEDGLTGLTVGADVAGLSGCFDLSNPVLVNRFTDGDCTLSVSDFDNLGVSIFPIPAKDVLSVQINDVVLGDVDIQLFNMLGQQVKANNGVKSSDAILMNVSDLQSGLYVLYVVNEAGRSASVQQIVIE